MSEVSNVSKVSNLALVMARASVFGRKERSASRMAGWKDEGTADVLKMLIGTNERESGRGIDAETRIEKRDW